MFIQRLKEARAAKKLSQKKLSELLHVSQQAVGHWESGRSTPSPEMLRNISEVLDVSTDYLIGKDNTDSVPNTPLIELRKNRNLSIEQLSELSGISERTLRSYEHGSLEPSYKMLLKLADFFEVSIDYLLGRDESAVDGPPPSTGGKWIPVLGRVAAGVPISAATDLLGWEEISMDTASKGEHFALRIKGDSMSPIINDGDIVIVRQQDIVDDGTIAIAIVDGEDAVCKKIFRQQNGVTLMSINPAYPPMFYTNEDIDSVPVRIIGKVIELRRSF